MPLLALILLTALSASAGSVDLESASAELGGLIRERRPAAGPDRPIAKSAFYYPPAAPASKPAEAEWLVMLFFNGKNNLAEAIMKDLNEAARVGSSLRVHVVAQIGQAGRGGGYTAGDKWEGARSFYLPGGKAMTPLSVQHYVPVANPDMGSWEQLSAFISSSKALYPAKKHLLVVSGHGAGWRGIAPDDLNRTQISLTELGKALARGGGVSVYASDACLMQMAEVVYEIRNSAEVVVGSEEVEPGSGYYYTPILDALTREPGMSAEALGRVITEAYGKQYSINPTSGGLTTSAIRTTAMEQFKSKFDRWSELLLRHDESAAIEYGARGARRFESSHSADLYDFAELVGQKTRNAETREAGKAVQDYLKKELVFANASGPRAHGLAVAVPLGADGSYGGGMAWLADTRWREIMRKNGTGFRSWQRP